MGILQFPQVTNKRLAASATSPVQFSDAAEKTFPSNPTSTIRVLYSRVRLPHPGFIRITADYRASGGFGISFFLSHYASRQSDTLLDLISDAITTPPVDLMTLPLGTTFTNADAPSLTSPQIYSTQNPTYHTVSRYFYNPIPRTVFLVASAGTDGGGAIRNIQVAYDIIDD